MCLRLAEIKGNELIANYMEGKAYPEYEVILNKNVSHRIVKSAIGQLSPALPLILRYDVTFEVKFHRFLPSPHFTSDHFMIDTPLYTSIVKIKVSQFFKSKMSCRGAERAKDILRKNQQLSKRHSMVYRPKTSPVLEANQKKMQESHMRYTEFMEQAKRNVEKKLQEIREKKAKK